MRHPKIQPTRKAGPPAIPLLGDYGGTKQIREPVRPHDQVPSQGQGPRCPYPIEIGVDGDVPPRLDVVDF